MIEVFLREEKGGKLLWGAPLLPSSFVNNTHADITRRADEQSGQEEDNTDAVVMLIVPQRNLP